MKKVVPVVALLNCMLFFSCQTDTRFEVESPESPLVNELVQATAVNLEHPAVGQKSYYQRCGFYCDEGDFSMELYSDTLVLEVIEGDDLADLFFRESVTPNSLSHSNFEPVTYPISNEEGSIGLFDPYGSYLFYGLGLERIDLNPLDLGELTLRQSSCELFKGDSNTQFRGPSTGFIADFSAEEVIFGEYGLADTPVDSYRLTNKAVVSRNDDFHPTFLFHDNYQISLSYLTGDVVPRHGPPYLFAEGWILINN